MLPPLQPWEPLAGLVLGSIAGSYIATLLIRWPKGASATLGRSRCDHCQYRLRATDLVPILSYLGRRGRCRVCGAAIDARHLLVELAAALIGAVAFLAHDGVVGLASCVFGWWLLLVATLDLEHHWLPDRLTLPLFPAGIAAAALMSLPIVERLGGALVGFAVLWLLARGYRRIRGREGMGGGDPKLLGGLGAWLGWQSLPFVLVGAGLVGLVAMLLLRLRGRHMAGSDRLPLGTLMAVAAWPIWLVTL